MRLFGRVHRLSYWLLGAAAVLVLATPAPSARADLANEDATPKYSYSWVPGIGYTFGFTDLTGKTNGLVNGVLGSIKFMIENENVFVFPDASISELIGMDKSPLTGYSIGLGLGGKTSSGLGIWGGFNYSAFLSYQASGAASLRAGIFFPMGKNRLEIEADATSYPVETATKILNYSYLSGIITYSFPISFPKSH